MGFIDNILENLGLDGLGEGVKSKMVMVGFNSLYLQGVKSILSFGEDEIVVSLKSYKVAVKGTGLSIGKFCEGDLVVCGKISAIVKE